MALEVVVGRGLWFLLELYVLQERRILGLPGPPQTYFFWGRCRVPPPPPFFFFPLGQSLTLLERSW